MAKIIWCPGEAEEAQAPSKSLESEDEKLEVKVGKQMGALSRAQASKGDKLEVNYDGAWFGAELSFRDGTTFVHLDGDSEDEGEEWNGEKIGSLQPNIKEKIRVVSDQLQDEDCGMVKLKMIVCAFRRGISQEGWYDALVTAVRRMPHQDGFCDCVFTVEWLVRHEGRNEEKVTCGDICLLSDKDVETHPTIVDILRRARASRRIGAQAEGQGRSAAKVRKWESETEDESENDNDEDPDYTPNPEEQQVAYLEEQGRLPLSNEPKKSQKSKALSSATSSRGRMRGAMRGSISSTHYGWHTQTV